MPNDMYSTEDLVRIHDTMVDCRGSLAYCPAICPFLHGVKLGHLWNCRQIVSSSDYDYVALPSWDRFMDWDELEILAVDEAMLNLDGGWYIATQYCPERSNAILYTIYQRK